MTKAQAITKLNIYFKGYGREIQPDLEAEKMKPRFIIAQGGWTGKSIAGNEFKASLVLEDGGEDEDCYYFRRLLFHYDGRRFHADSKERRNRVKVWGIPG
jgi:hypothetical protein